jgi:predicted 2-oxoglutarate/Fe(II)-dependent dioxygenase YbiX
MSVNLTPEVYFGGTLQLRDPHSHRMLQEVANTGPRDAILFRIGSDLQHRVTPVNGTLPKSAYAGWFQSEKVAGSTFGVIANAPSEEERRRASDRL